jgi:hypothetical protein
MTLLESDIDRLTVDSRKRLDTFYRRFCEGTSRRQYGLGHLLYACHAAFPLVLSPDLANLLYINFNHYSFYDGSTGNIASLAPSDVLLSPLCKQISNRQFEMLPEIRSFLLNLLKDGRWFYRYGIVLKGEERLFDLADFLQQYLALKVLGNSFEASGFKRLNEWASLAYSNPGELARQIGKVLEEKCTDDQGQLWLNSQMDRLEKQYRFNVHNANGNGLEVLAPFFNLYYYSQSRKHEMFGQSQQAQINASQIMNLPLSVNGGATISLPLAKNIADRTERRLNNIQRVVSLLIGIDEYKEHPLKGCVSSAKNLQELLIHLAVKREDRIQGKKENSINADSVFTVFNEQATRQNILGSVAAIFKEANPEDVCLVYFAGHAQNKSYTENTLFPVDTEFGNSHDLVNEDFLKAFIEGKRKTPCQVVMILDSHTGYYHWVNEDDIFLGAVRHTTQTEVQIKGNTTESPFFNALTYILSCTRGTITYRHLLLWLRFYVKNMFPESDEQPVLMASPSNLDKYFLRADLRNINDAPVIAFNKEHNYWQVLQEDFKLIIINTLANLKDYNTFQDIPDARGEVFVREGELRFGGATTGLNVDSIYRLDIQKSRLPVIFSIENAEENWLKVLNDLGFGAFSKWQTLEFFLEGDKTLRDDAERLVLDNVESGYILSYNTTDEHEKAYVRELEIGGANFLRDAIEKFVRYHYLCNLQLLQDYNKIYAPLDILFSVGWKGNWTGKFLDSEHLNINEEAFSISEGEIKFYPFELNIENKESFPVYCSLYILASNFTIKMIPAQALNPIMPHTTATVIMDEPEYFELILSQSLNGQLKLLASRDPVQVDFSQSGVLSR